jgi:threonine dehydrogenase-like Zn-dependent dehydrogenase
MKLVTQSVRTGEVAVTDAPVPRPSAGQVLVRVEASLLSAGTERMVMDFASKNLLAKAKARPDLTRQVLDKARQEGVLPTLEAVRSRLNRPLSLGYSCAGTVIEIGNAITDLRVGDRVACAGLGYAVHAEAVAVPRQLVVRIPDPAPGRAREPVPSPPSAPPETGAEERDPSIVTTEEAAFTTLGAIALQGIRLADVRLGEVVAVIGLGLLGQLAVQALKAAGCTVVGMDLQPARMPWPPMRRACGQRYSSAPRATGRTRC